MSRERTVPRWIAFVVAAFILLGPHADAKEKRSFVWSGGVDKTTGSDWKSTANWENGNPPKPNDRTTVVIPGECDTYPRITEDTLVPGILRIEDGAKITVSGARLTIENGLFVELGGEVEILEGGEIWTDVIRDKVASRGNAHTNIPIRDDAYDVGLKLRRSFRASELLPDVRLSGGPLPEVWTFDVGPELPKEISLIDIAPYAERSSRPYTGMTTNFVDIDPNFRTLSMVEPGIPNASCRFDFRFDSPRKIAKVEWNSPVSRWALFGDADGDGTFEQILAMDLGEVTNMKPDGTWQNRVTASVAIWPAMELRAVRIVDLQNSGNNQGSPIYAVRIFAPADAADFGRPHPHSVMRGEHLEGKPSEIGLGPALAVTPPEAGKRIPRGFHIEPWMFNLDEWIDKPQAERPPLSEYEPFVGFIKSLRALHADTVNLWPPKKFNKPRGKGVYEMDMLWPSAYDRHSLDENILAQVAEAFRKEGIRFMSMTRTAYPKPLEEFPKLDPPLPDIQVIERKDIEYLAGIVREQTASGVAGVGIGFDEQESRRINTPAAYRWGKAGEAFKKQYGIEMPMDIEDSLAFRKWVVFAYEQFADYLGAATTTAKQTNPNVLTKSPVHLTIASACNDRTLYGIAEDIVARRADIDYSRAYGYFGYNTLGHYVVAFATKVSAGGRQDRKTVSLHNCPWTHDPKADPGFFLHFPPVYMLASPISAVMNGGGMPLFWRYNWIFREGYEEQVRKSFAILDALSAWGMADAHVPKSVAVLRSRASEDWWQVRQRYRKDGDIMDQTRGHICFKAVVESLLTEGYPFDVFYLDHPSELEASLKSYDLLILPFPYSVSDDALAALEKLGKPMILFDRRGETDEWGEPRETPAFSSMIAAGKAVFADDDLPAVGQHTAFRRSLRERIDGMLGNRKTHRLNTYGNDVEMTMLEKGDREKFVGFTNWTERPVVVDAGVTVPNGAYRIRQAGSDGAHTLTVGGREVVDAATLADFRITIAPWDVRVLHIHPEP